MFTNLCRKVGVALDNLKHDERGVSAIEYAILAAVVAVVLAFALNAGGEGGWFTDIFGKMEEKVSDAMDTTPTP